MTIRLLKIFALAFCVIYTLLSIFDGSMMEFIKGH